MFTEKLSGCESCMTYGEINVMKVGYRAKVGCEPRFVMKNKSFAIEAGGMTYSPQNA